MVAEELKKEILYRRENHLRSQARLSRQTCCRASNITECAREMVYSIINWDKKPLPEPELIARFEEGKEQERKVIKELLDLGFEVAEGQQAYELKDRKGRVVCTLHIDGKCYHKSKKVPFEVKSLDPNVYNQLNSADDFNKYDWAKRYLRQIQCYLFGTGEEEGIFIITDCKGHWKIFPVTIQYEEMERILQLCEYVMDCVESGTMPEFALNAAMCRKCWACKNVCFPPLDFGNGVQVVDDPEILLALENRESLKAKAKEYEVVDKQVKEYFKNRPHTVCGEFEIVGTEQTRKYKASEAREVKTWVTTIEKIGK